MYQSGDGKYTSERLLLYEMNGKPTDILCEVDRNGLSGVHVELHADTIVKSDCARQGFSSDSDMSSLTEVGGLHDLYPATCKAGGVTRLLLDAEELCIGCGYLDSLLLAVAVDTDVSE